MEATRLKTGADKPWLGPCKAEATSRSSGTLAALRAQGSPGKHRWPSQEERRPTLSDSGRRLRSQPEPLTSGTAPGLRAAPPAA